VCTLCRPFDDQSVMRIRLETNAYYLMLQAVQDGKYTMVVSLAHFEEINAISDPEERREALAVLAKLGTTSEYDSTAVRARAVELHSRELGIADAAHVALAEATADFFITCDDRLLRQCKTQRVAIITMNPVEFTITEDLK
ncbi:MAG TPA: PIN domain-containing protein, partial [Candidatus Limnocylindrales bacterium]|nr:PIN domain-containing protein [Candidatus Limnocylindrales bacterium]